MYEYPEDIIDKQEAMREKQIDDTKQEGDESQHKDHPALKLARISQGMSFTTLMLIAVNWILALVAISSIFVGVCYLLYILTIPVILMITVLVLIISSRIKGKDIGRERRSWAVLMLVTSFLAWILNIAFFIFLIIEFSY